MGLVHRNCKYIIKNQQIIRGLKARLHISTFNGSLISVTIANVSIVVLVLQPELVQLTSQDIDFMIFSLNHSKLFKNQNISSNYHDYYVSSCDLLFGLS